MSMNQSLQLKAVGRLLVTDHSTGEVVLQKNNAIHPQNLALTVARALAQETNGSIYKMCFGNGGTFLNSSSQLNYRSPNTIGAADLYNQTYEVIVDDFAVGCPPSNSVVALPSPPPSIISLIVVTAVLSANEPTGQAVTDGVTVDPEADFVFDELALKTENDLLLTHMVFSPIEKTANRALLFTYTIDISLA